MAAAVGAVLLTAGCGGATTSSDSASTDQAQPSSTQTDSEHLSVPFDERLAECEANINAGITNVRATPDFVAEAIIAASGPAQIAATLRAEADALSELIANQAARCSELLPECPDVAKAWQVWAQQFIDGGIRSMADITLGTQGGYADTELPGDMPDLSC